MADQRDRSPSYPNIPLGTALDRLTAFESHFKRSPARAETVGDAWGIKAKAYAGRTAAALRYYGLFDYQSAENGRQIVISEEGRKFLRAQQDHIKQEVVRKAALCPTQIGKFWNLWGPDRPADAACLDELVIKNNFSEKGARKFLSVYDATIAYAGLSDSDKVYQPDDEESEALDERRDQGGVNENDGDSDPPLPPKKGKVKLMEGERELTTGMLSRDAGFRLIVSGEIGVKEIERLIAKLELDKEILSEPDGDEENQ